MKVGDKKLERENRQRESECACVCEWRGKREGDRVERKERVR